jgi:hypothetical protein
VHPPKGFFSFLDNLLFTLEVDKANDLGSQVVAHGAAKSIERGQPARAFAKKYNGSMTFVCTKYTTEESDRITIRVKFSPENLVLAFS